MVLGFVFGARVWGHSLNGLRLEYGTLLPAHQVDDTSGLGIIDDEFFRQYFRRFIKFYRTTSLRGRLSEHFRLSNETELMDMDALFQTL